MPVPSIAPTTWFVPETTIPDAVLLFVMCARFPLAEPRAEIESASSSVAPAATVTVAAAAIVGSPEAILNLSRPAETVVLPEYLFAPESVHVPLPLLAIAKTPVLWSVRTPLIVLAPVLPPFNVSVVVPVVGPGVIPPPKLSELCCCWRRW